MMTETQPQPTAPVNVWNLPNLLTTLRLGMAVVLFVCVSYELWWVALGVFAVAAYTDWLDGHLARKHGTGSAFGRNYDPLVDKVLVGGMFIFLLPVKAAGLTPWMVTLVVSRELIVTGLRSFFEGHGVKFGADFLGKIKMGLQCAALIAILLVLALPESSSAREALEPVQTGLLWAMLAATALSGTQYVAKALALIRS
jgi:CDP-diacylglycerol--glycerol-3-phosphate 3-phosphatidyltransferase